MLDTNSKSNRNKKIFVSTSIVILMLIASFTMILKYPLIEKKVRENTQNPFQNKKFAHEIYYSNYYLYHNMYQKETDKLIRPAELFLRRDTIKYITNNFDIDYYAGSFTESDVTKAFDEAFVKAGYLINDSGDNLEYDIINKETGFSFGNDEQDLSMFDVSMNVHGFDDKNDEKTSENDKYDNSVGSNGSHDITDNDADASNKGADSAKDLNQSSANQKGAAQGDANQTGANQDSSNQGMVGSDSSNASSDSREVSADNRIVSVPTNQRKAIAEYERASKEKRQRYFNNLRKEYRLFLVFDYDSEGQLRIPYTYGINRKFLEREILDLATKENIENNGESLDGELELCRFKKEPVRNVVVFYGIPANIKSDFYDSHDSISSYLNKGEKESYKIVTDIMKIVMICVAIIALLFPYQQLKNLVFYDRMRRLPIEINIIWMSLLMTFLLGDVKYIRIVRATISGDLLKKVLSNDLSLWISKLIVNSTNIGYLFAIYMCLFIIVSYAKDIIISRPIGFIRENSMIIGGCRFFAKYFRGLISRLNAVDYSRKYIRVIVLAIVGNTMISLFMFTLGLVGIILVMMYNIGLFMFFKSRGDEISKDYEKVVGIANQIAEADFAKDLEHIDVGVFARIKAGLIGIQVGFKKSNEEEGRTQRLKSELISNVSHDLKTPLTSIISYIDLIKDENVDEESRMNYINTIDRKAQRLKSLIEDLFEISKANSGNVKLDLQELDIVALMKQALFELEDNIEKARLRPKVELPEDKVMLVLDGARTYRVFENLILNMCKYAMPDSRVFISIFDKDDRVVVEMKNMSATEIDYEGNDVLERFVRGDKSRNTEGSGLGLAIAKSFVELQGGEIEIQIDGDLFKVIITIPKKPTIMENE